MLGFHYSRWEHITASEMIKRNQEFTLNKFPVDVFWLDIEHTPQKQYFEWNRTTFPQELVEVMSHQIRAESRRLVVITDPHIRADPGYRAYLHGLEPNMTAPFFVRDCTNQTFVGESWPGKSTWIDFFNEPAREFWGSLYRSFEQTPADLYSFWIDMNEPAVFNSVEQQTFPLTCLHRVQGSQDVLHRDVHNAYGLFMQKASFSAIQKLSARRAFLLTRSYFISSQQFGAFWTGDNFS